jgi:hypothetical protein
VRTVPEASTRPAATVAAVARRLTLELRLAPALYRIAVRARLDAGGLSPPALAFVRVLDR